MAFRFRKSIKIAPGVRLNLSRSGVSTTLGGRGLSMNVSRRGTRVTAGIPGTGISYQVRSGGSSGRGAGGAGVTGREAEGCLGCGAVGFFMLLLMGLCASPDRSGTPAYRTDPLMLPPPTSQPAQEPRETFYLHGSLNLRSGPGRAFAVTRTLPRGEQVTLGAKDANGWAPAFDRHGQREGFVYRASDHVRSYAPAALRPRAPRHPSGASAICRDGTYSYSGSRRGTCSWHGGVAQWL